MIISISTRHCLNHQLWCINYQRSAPSEPSSPPWGRRYSSLETTRIRNQLLYHNHPALELTAQPQVMEHNRPSLTSFVIEYFCAQVLFFCTFFFYPYLKNWCDLCIIIVSVLSKSMCLRCRCKHALHCICTSPCQCIWQKTWLDPTPLGLNATQCPM